jgi:membrane protein DedA with SNARE-associated domain
MNHLIPYLGILAAAAIEGEFVYSGAVVAAMLGKLDAFGVLVSGWIGGWAGDQFWYYAARGPLRSWMNRFENIAMRRRAIEQRMQIHASKLILGIRFLPGLRIAIPVACAYSGISAIHFSGLSLISAFAWAGSIMLAIRTMGFSSFSSLGLKAWWAPALPAIAVVLFFRWLSRTGPQEQAPLESPETEKVGG